MHKRREREKKGLGSFRLKGGAWTKKNFGFINYNTNVNLNQLGLVIV